MSKILYYSILFSLLAGIVDVQAQNQKGDEQQQSTGKKRTRPEREKPERAFRITKKNISSTLKKNVSGNWKSYIVAFDENDNKGNSELNPILIESEGHLAYLAQQVNTGNSYAGKHFLLQKNLDLGAHEWTPIGMFGSDIKDNTYRFCGFFHGNGNKIENLVINKTTDYQGLWGVCGMGAYIEQVKIVNCYVRGGMQIGGLVGLTTNECIIIDCSVTGEVLGINSGVGGIVGVNNGSIINSNASIFVNGDGNDVGGIAGVNGDFTPGIISNCHSTGDINGFYNVGGLIGRNNGTITNCYSSGRVNGEEWVGGLVGWTDNGIISHSNATGNVSGYFDIGGLVGFNGYQKSSVMITSCYATGSVYGNGLGNYCVGGLVGYSGGMVIDSYSTGDVKGEESIGGLIGEHGGSLTNCYSSGNVNGNYDVGGLIGFNGYPGTMTSIINCYATGNVRGYDIGNYGIGGLAGYSGGSITNSYSSGNVEGDETIGGLLGENDGVLLNCFSIGSVGGLRQVGGLVGGNWGIITSCYASGLVDGSKISGGLIGENNDKEAKISFSYYDSETTRQKSGIGRDNNQQKKNIIPMKTEELTGTLPEGFDPDVWEVSDGNYPRLKSVK